MQPFLGATVITTSALTWFACSRTTLKQGRHGLFVTLVITVVFSIKTIVVYRQFFNNKATRSEAYLGNHGQPEEKPDCTYNSSENFLTVATSQVLRIPIHNCGHNTFDTYKLNSQRNQKSVVTQFKEKNGNKLWKLTLSYRLNCQCS